MDRRKSYEGDSDISIDDNDLVESAKARNRKQKIRRGKQNKEIKSLDSDISQNNKVSFNS